jgi:hypothetical protein
MARCRDQAYSPYVTQISHGWVSGLVWGDVVLGPATVFPKEGDHEALPVDDPWPKPNLLGKLRDEVARSGGLVNPAGQVQPVDLTPWEGLSAQTPFYVIFSAREANDSA